jgi:hypothetical protein
MGIRFLLLVFLSYFVAACGPSRMVSIRITRPAVIRFPAGVQSLVVADRTRPNQAALNVIEGILTGELPSEDRINAQEAVNSLRNRLGSSPRFSVKLFPERLMGNSLTSAFPDPLDWLKVKEICEREQSDVLLCIEIMDSDFIITHGSRIRNRREGSRQVEFTEFFAQGVGNIKMGIRAYYPKTNTILDQQIFRNSQTWEGAGSNPAAALALLINRAEANRQLVRLIAADYAYKISPMPVWIQRNMYGRSRETPSIEAGRREADVGKWKEAAETWKNGFLTSVNAKSSGKLAYNVAVAYEVMGELNLALQWAQDSYTRFGNSFGRRYAFQIEQRIQEELELNRQMSR